MAGVTYINNDKHWVNTSLIIYWICPNSMQNIYRFNSLNVQENTYFTGAVLKWVLLTGLSKVLTWFILFVVSVEMRLSPRRSM